MYATSTLVFVLHIAGSGGNGGLLRPEAYRGAQKGGWGPGNSRLAGVTIPWARHSCEAGAHPEGAPATASGGPGPELQPCPADRGLQGSGAGWSADVGRGTSGAGPRHSPEGGRSRSTYQADKAAHEPHQAQQLPQPFMFQRCVLQPGLQGATALRYMFQAHAPRVTGGSCAKTSCGYFCLEVRSCDRGSAPRRHRSPGPAEGPTRRPGQAAGERADGAGEDARALNTVSTCLTERSGEARAQGGQGAP